MAHVSTNPPWEDYPSLATLISANALENIENAVDSLADSTVTQASFEDHSSRHATGGEDPITPESIGAASQADFEQRPHVKQDLASERLYFETGV